MKSSPEQSPEHTKHDVSEKSKQRNASSQETAVSKKYSRDDVYIPEIEADIQALKNALRDRELLLTKLNEAKAAHDKKVAIHIEKDLENLEDEIRKFAAVLSEDIAIERGQLQKLHEWLESNLDTEH